MKKEKTDKPKTIVLKINNLKHNIKLKKETEKNGKISK